VTRRLPSLNRAFRLSDRIKLRMIRLASGRDPSDILRLLFYRSDYFGVPFTAWVDAVLRGPSDWSVGERELFATLVSSLNRCRFCAGSHGAIASLELGAETTAAVIADWRQAPVDARLLAAFGFIEALTLRPETVTAEDVAPLRAEGVSAEAIADLAHIAAMFATINRIADTVDFAVPDSADQADRAAGSVKRGYAI